MRASLLSLPLLFSPAATVLKPIIATVVTAPPRAEVGRCNSRTVQVSERCQARGRGSIRGVRRSDARGGSACMG
ncbi:hypothetical protein V6Z11_A04G111700 [Gossypium hirsutum]|uniref:Secreted protein n=1 Tax=Gossypium tomentosum TaxID=34277 RepID=A0A5D2R0A7_GOSTO|nr:hypothetical protein ES332_A04G114100v1 [Gossypium tomentosum]